MSLQVIFFITYIKRMIHPDNYKLNKANNQDYVEETLELLDVK